MCLLLQFSFRKVYSNPCNTLVTEYFLNTFSFRMIGLINPQLYHFDNDIIAAIPKKGNMNEITVFFSISLGSLPFGDPFDSSVRPFKHRVLHAPHRLLLMTVPPQNVFLLYIGAYFTSSKSTYSPSSLLKILLLRRWRELPWLLSWCALPADEGRW